MHHQFAPFSLAIRTTMNGVYIIMLPWRGQWEEPIIIAAADDERASHLLVSNYNKIT